MGAVPAVLIEFQSLELGRVNGQKSRNQGEISNTKNITTTPLEVGENRPNQMKGAFY
jgi:hypothetical protein